MFFVKKNHIFNGGDSITDKYKNYIRSPEWEKKKQERIKIDDYKCAMCQRPVSRIRVLQCHHTNYKRLGNEDVYSDLVTLCGTCHKKLHNYLNRIKSPYDERLRKEEK